MEQATDMTVQSPETVLAHVQSALTSQTIPAQLSINDPHSDAQGPSQEMEEQGAEEAQSSLLSGEVVTAIVETMQTKPVSPIEEPRKRVHIPASANIPHKPSNVKQWVGTVGPVIGGGVTDPEAGDDIVGDGSIYGDPQVEEDKPSDAGSVRSELHMFKMYVEDQMEKTRAFMDEQMRDTHNLITKIETRLSVLERKINLPVSRQTSVSLPTAPKVQLPVAPSASPLPATTTVASKQAVASQSVYGGLIELPLYSPNKTIQARTINRSLKSQGVTLQPLIKAIPRKDWSLQYINSLPVFKY